MNCYKTNKRKVYFTFFVFVALFFLVLLKAFKVQLVDKKKLLARSKNQIFREIKIYPKRGSIYDRVGKSLAINIQTYSIFTIPKELKGNFSNYKKLSKIVPSLNYQYIKKKVYKRKRYTWIARKISLTKIQAAKIKKLKGVYIDTVPKRIYPNNEVGAQILGFVGIDNVGLAGIEYRFDKELRGKPKVVKYVKDAKGRPIKFESQDLGANKKDIYLSIDKQLQAIAEKYLKEKVLESKAIRGGIGIMDSSNGEILAMSNYPTFNPNKITNTNKHFTKMSFATDPIEPGSTFKTFTIASALENKTAKADTSYYCEKGEFLVEGHVISEAESKKQFEWLSVSEILKYSSNIGTTKIAFDLTYPKLKKTLKKFNFGEKTGIEIPGESRGIFNEDENVPPLSLSNISFGQGVATTGVQMLAAYSAIANGGYYYPPTLLLDGNKDYRPERIISKETSKELEKMLVEAVDSGTGGNAKIDLFQVAGKTSTAQRSDKFGKYTGYTAGFIGYPVNVDKRYIIYVYIEKPTGAYYGNLIAGPVFRKVTEYVLYKNKDFNKIVISDKNQSNKNFDTVKVKHSSTRIKGHDKVPNFKGLDKISTKNLADDFGLKIFQKGMGVVISQSPKPGSPLEKDMIVELNYALPSYE